MILGWLWMKNHGVIIDMTNNAWVFKFSYWIYVDVSFSNILSQPILPSKIAVIRLDKDINPPKSIKRGLTEDITDFLQMANKLLSKKTIKK